MYLQLQSVITDEEAYAVLVGIEASFAELWGISPQAVIMLGNGLFRAPERVFGRLCEDKGSIRFRPINFP